MKIHVVFGTTGEYLDRTEWLVIAYYDDAMAQAHVVNAQQKADEWDFAVQCSNDYPELPDGYNKYDVNMQSYFGETRYYYETTEIGETVI